ncbi:MAG TPA: hypothetical protein ENL20_11965 [Candidatus Cloacimonetes bacterium]|nr:hypothetical protein [Candidatus Cloacimonadota bacterium]
MKETKKKKDEQIIVKADKNYRKKILLIAFTLIVIGFFLLRYFQALLNRLSTLAEESPGLAIKKAENSLKIIFFVMFLLSLGLCFYLYRLGTSILKSEQFPPPGIKVIKDTKLETGRKARSRGRMLQVLSILFLMMGVLVPITVSLILRNF